MHTHFLGPLTEKVKGTPAAVNILSREILVSEEHSPAKEKSLILRGRQNTRRALKTGSLFKRTHNLEALNIHNWDNLSKKIGNNGKVLDF